MRALVVLLLIMNIGFAAWQLTRHEAPPVRLAAADAGVDPLRLLTEMAKPLPAKEPAEPPSQPSAKPAVHPPVVSTPASTPVLPLP